MGIGTEKLIINSLSVDWYFNKVEAKRIPYSFIMEQIVAVSVFQQLAYVLEKTKLGKSGSFRMISTRQARYVVDRYVVSNVKEGEMLSIRVFCSRLS
jgi:hypothetical protein